jgi:hypothetical protein
MPYSHFRLSSERSIASGLTRVELLVVVCLFVILVGVGYYSISSYLERISPSRGVECARTIDTLLSQYATDNNGVYPVGEGTQAIGKAEGIARNLLENNYMPDASVFAVGSTTRYGGNDDNFSGIDAAHISWDFTAASTCSTGLTSAAPDLLPMVYTTGENIAYPSTPGAGLNVLLSGNGPFGKKGMAVAYKSGNASFLKATPSGATLECEGFISTDLKDTGPYTQIRP